MAKVETPAKAAVGGGVARGASKTFGSVGRASRRLLPFRLGACVLFAASFASGQAMAAASVSKDFLQQITGPIGGAETPVVTVNRGDVVTMKIDVLNSANLLSGGSLTDTLPTGMTQVAVGDAKIIWALNAVGEVFRWNGTAWQLMPGNLKSISVAADGTVWGVNAEGSIWQWIP